MVIFVNESGVQTDWLEVFFQKQTALMALFQVIQLRWSFTGVKYTDQAYQQRVDEFLRIPTTTGLYQFCQVYGHPGFDDTTGDNGSWTFELFSNQVR